MRWFIFCLILSSYQSSYAADYVLFEKRGIPTGGWGKYYDTLDALTFGDRIQFSNGEWIQIGNKVGHGDTSVIYETGPTEVIRLNKNHLLHEATRHTYDAYADLKRNGVSVVDIDLQRSIREEMIIQKRVTVRIDLTNYIRGRKNDSLGDDLDSEIAKKLLDFAASTSRYEWIGDAKFDNIVFTDGGRWALLDWADAPIYARSSSRKSLFENLGKTYNFIRDPMRNKLMMKLQRRIETVIFMKRRRDCIMLFSQAEH